MLMMIIMVIIIMIIIIMVRRVDSTRPSQSKARSFNHHCYNDDDGFDGGDVHVHVCALDQKSYTNNNQKLVIRSAKNYLYQYL